MFPYCYDLHVQEVLRFVDTAVRLGKERVLPYCCALHILTLSSISLEWAPDSLNMLRTTQQKNPCLQEKKWNKKGETNKQL